MSKSRIPGDRPAEKKPEIERDPAAPAERHEPEIPDVPRRKPDMDKPAPDKPEIEIDTPTDEQGGIRR